jgi:hypothetical protein
MRKIQKKSLTIKGDIMRQLIADSGFFDGVPMTIYWDEDKPVKEIFKRDVEMYDTIIKWATRKRNAELERMMKKPEWEVI